MKSFKIFIAGILLAAAVPAPAGPRAAPQAGLQVPIQANSYDAAGRRDPFRNLLAGKELSEKKTIAGISDLQIEEISIIGLVKTKGRYEAVIGMPSGFPMTAREGDRFADGYVLSIREGEVVLRKTKERGVPLVKPKDIVREITSEER